MDLRGTDDVVGSGRKEKLVRIGRRKFQFAHRPGTGSWWIICRRSEAKSATDLGYRLIMIRDGIRLKKPRGKDVLRKRMRKEEEVQGQRGGLESAESGREPPYNAPKWPHVRNKGQKGEWERCLSIIMYAVST